MSLVSFARFRPFVTSFTFLWKNCHSHYYRSSAFHLLNVVRTSQQRETSNAAVCFSTNVVQTCWQCLHPSSWEYFQCKKCGAVQKVDPNVNYFKVFGIQQNFSLDTVALTNTFRSLQAQFHPDKFAGKSEKEQKLSLDCSSFLNHAYQTLTRPVMRGEYLLALNQQANEDNLTMDQGFLMEMMEINELLAAEMSQPRLEHLKTQNSKTINRIMDLLADAFNNKDFDKAKMLLAKLKYYINIQEKMKSLDVVQHL